MKKINGNFYIGAGFFVTFILFTILVKLVDVQAIGPLGSEVGFAGLNELFLKTNANSCWDSVSDVFMILALISALCFAVVGVVQLIKRKSLKKVDKNLFVLLGLYLLVVAVYVFFELVVVNYRPILEDSKLVASYPSSHVLISVVFIIAATIQLHKYLKNRKNLLVIDVLTSVFVVLLVCSRMLSGVHWITDIIAALLVSSALLFTYNGVLNQFIKVK